MSSHSKCSVVVISSTGSAHTTKRGARRLIDRKLAERMPDGTLRMIEDDHRFQCAAASSAGPKLEVIAPPAFSLCWLNSEAAVLRFPGKAA